jgi:hypothetical protein
LFFKKNSLVSFGIKSCKRYTSSYIPSQVREGYHLYRSVWMKRVVGHSSNMATTTLKYFEMKRLSQAHPKV